MPKPRYRYEVSHTSAEGFTEWAMATTSADDSMGYMVSSLRDSGWDDHALPDILANCAKAFMSGESSFTALDPDLQGSTSITRIATN
jgi:hypothetical protein